MDIYSKIISCFDLKRGDCIWLSSELIKLVLLLKRNNITFDGNALIETFQKAVGQEGTILIPNFSFEFSNHKFYDIRKTKVLQVLLVILLLTEMTLKEPNILCILLRFGVKIKTI